MSTVQVTKCDVCGAQKKEVNHWFVVWIVPNINVFQCCSAETYIEKYPAWYIHTDVCGRECASKLFSRFLETGSLEPKP